MYTIINKTTNQPHAFFEKSGVNFYPEKSIREDNKMVTLTDQGLDLFWHLPRYHDNECMIVIFLLRREP